MTEERKPFLVQVRFKNDPVCPCPNILKMHNLEGWQRIRGQPVTLIRPFPVELVAENTLCGSDTYWLIVRDKLVDIVARGAGNYRAGIVTCRHMLDIGD